MLSDEVRAALAPLPSGYSAIALRIQQWATNDDRVRGCWLAGSLGRGESDAGSDLDVVLAVADAHLDHLLQTWRAWLATWTPTIIADQVPGVAGCYTSVTPDCERVDVVVEAVSALASSQVRARLVLVDKDGLTALVPAPALTGGPDVTRLGALIQEFHRQQALFPDAVVARGDWLLGVVGVGQMQLLLYQLFVETNAPLPPMGVKQWSRRLTDRQRSVLAALPTPAADRDSVIEAMAAARRAMCTEGRRAAEHAGLVWPQTLADAVSRHVDSVLGPV